MAAFGGIGFCCCGGPCPCAVSDDFASDSIADYDVTGTFTVASGVLKASTAGTATQSLRLPSGTRAAGVRADVIDDSHALFGLVIGVGDNRIEWLWDVANTQCTLLVYSEGVAIVDEDYAGDPTTSLEVQITPNDCSWDVAVYRDGTLLDTHTAVAVTFDADWAPFGVTSDSSGGTWDNLCLRACHTPCVITGCAGLRLPVGYTLAAGTYTDNASFSDPSACSSCCDSLSGDWTMLNGSLCVGFTDGYYTNQFDGGLTSAACAYLAVDTDRWVESGVDWAAPNPVGLAGCDAPDPLTRLSEHPANPFFDDDDRPIKLATLPIQCIDGACVPVRLVPFNSDGTLSDCPLTSRWFFTVGYTGSPGSYTAHIDLTGSMIWESGGGASGFEPWRMIRYSLDIAIGDDLDLASLGVLTLSRDMTADDDAEGDEMCDGPSTVTLTPLSSAEIVANDYLDGSDGCGAVERCARLYSEHGLLSLGGSIGGDDFRVCLSGPAGLSNGPFTGVINGATQGMTGDCAAATIAVSLECKRVCEHRYAWVLSLDDGTNTAELEYEPAAAPNVGDLVSGAVTLCGGSQAFAALLSDFTGLVEDHPFSCVCGEVDPALVCEVSDVLHVRGESDGTLCVPSSCTSTPGTLDLTQGEILCSGTPISASGFDDEKPYFRGPLPVNDSFGTFDGFEIVLYCDGSALQALMLDATNCIVDAGIVSIDCETLTGTIDFTNLNTACCASGSFKVHFG